MANSDSKKKPTNGKMKNNDVVQNPVVPKVEAEKNKPKKASGD